MGALAVDGPDMDHETLASRRPRQLTAIQCALIVGAIAVAVLTRRTDHWDLWPLLVITAFAVVSELRSMLATVEDAAVSGSSLAIALTVVLLGGAPAAVLSVLVLVVGWRHSREPGWAFRGNLVSFAWFPLLTGLAFHALVSATGAGIGDPGYYLLVFGAALIALGLNLLGTATTYRVGHRGSSISATIIAMVRPVLSAELFSALLTVVAAFAAIHLHLAGLIIVAVFLAVCQYLLVELFTSQQRSEKLKRLATTDELTGLGNRVEFHRAIEQRIIAAERAGAGFPVLLMDLDRFKEINDTLGHAYGDRMLRELGPRLAAAAGEGGVVARLGGDEFGILLGDELDAALSLEPAVNRLLAAVSEPFAVDELSLEVGASVGAARFPHDGEDAGALLRCADIAMYAAKEAQSGLKLYTAEQNQHSMRRLSVLSDIRRALAADEIVVHYQPIVDLDDRRVTGAEGLVRWAHPEHGLIPPGAFVQTVEQSGLIGPLTRHVLEDAIAQCAGWRRDGREMSVAVNLSVRNLLDRDLPREIGQMLDSHRVPASALQLEITESMIMSDPDRAIATVGRLSDLGVRLSVDDFGTGYSSLANLRRLPIDELKIDRSFVSPMLHDESDLIIVRSTINLGHDLGLRIIAEGVEDGPTLERLALLGCDLAQGYHLSRPMDAGAFNRWLADTPRDVPAAPVAVALPHPRPLPAGWTTTTSGMIVAAPEL